MRDYDSEWEDFLHEVADVIKNDYLQYASIPSGLNDPCLTIRHNCIFLAGTVNGIFVLVDEPIWDIEHGEDGLSDSLFEALGEEKYEELWAKLEPVMERF